MQHSHGLTLSSELCRQILSHARTARPREAVGLLGGSATGQVLTAVPLPNIAHSNNAFLADPYAQFCALRTLQARDLRLLAIYHSHPGGGVDPSHDDLAYAKQWSCVHLIIAVDAHAEGAAKARAFRYNSHGSIEDVEIRLSSVEPQGTAICLGDAAR